MLGYSWTIHHGDSFVSLLFYVLTWHTYTELADFEQFVYYTRILHIIYVTLMEQLLIRFSYHLLVTAAFCH